MNKSFLLGLALVFGSAAAQAQVLVNEDFSAEQTKSATDQGYYEFINTQEGDTREVKDGMLHFYNTDEVVGSSWQRAIKFRNLPVEENTFYRVSFKLMGSNTYYDVDKDENVRCAAHFALMQGGENLDMGFLAQDGSQFGNDIDRFQEVETGMYTYTGLFYYSTDAAHKAWYAENHPDKDELPATYFLTLNVFNPGDFYIDDVVVEKVQPAAPAFCDDVLRLDFGYDTNAKRLLGNNKYVVLPEGTATVTVNGEAKQVLSVEIKEDGKIYVFLGDEFYCDAEDDVEVSFHNPEGDLQIRYADGKTPGGAVADFTNVKATYDENMESVISWVYETPVLVSADPENGSFNLPVGKTDFKFTFNKPVDCEKIEATFDGAAMTVTPAEGYASEIIFNRAEGDLAGRHTIAVTKIYPQEILLEEVFGSESIEVSFGPVDTSETVATIMEDNFDATISEHNEGTIPAGWDVYNDDDAPIEQGTNPGSGSRTFKFADGGDFTAAIYFRSGNNAGLGGCGYGYTEGSELTLEAGKRYQIHYLLAAWKGTPWASLEVIDADDNVVLTRTDACTPNMNGQKTAVNGANVVEFIFVPAATGNYRLRWHPLTNADGGTGSWVECLLGKVWVKFMPDATGVDEVNTLNQALENAKAVRDGNNAERYAGPDFDTLNNAINKHDGMATVYTAPSVFRAAVAELNAAADAMKNHRSLCDAYDPLVAAAESARDMRTGTKFENHESYPALVAQIEKYKDQVLTDNDELTVAIHDLTVATNYVKNIGTIVQILTATMTDGLKTIEQLEGQSNEELATKVNDLLTDDPAVKSAVKGTIRNDVNVMLSDVANDFFDEKIDPVTEMVYTDSLNMSVFINNPDFYYTGWDEKTAEKKVNPTSENTPGWTITPGSGWSGGFAFHYPWGGNQQYIYNEESCPVAQGMITSWGYSYKIEQDVEGLPAGTYTLYVGVGERMGDKTDDPSLVTSYVFANTTDEEHTAIIPVIPGSKEPADNLVIDSLVITDGHLHIGFEHTAEPSQATFLNHFHLFMKQKAPGYDYAAGIKGVSEEVNNVVRTETYDLNGRRVFGEAKGLVLIKKVMSNGKTETIKVIK